MTQNNKPEWIDDIVVIPKVNQSKYPSPDLSKRVAIWSEREKAWFYFKKDATEEFIMDRLTLYKNRIK